MTTETGPLDQSQTAAAPTPGAQSFAGMAKSFGKAAAEFFKARTKVQATLDGVIGRIGELEAERNVLMRAPSTREDFCEALCVDIDRRAERFKVALQSIVDADVKRLAGNERTRARAKASGLALDRVGNQLRPGAEPGALQVRDVSWDRVRSVIGGDGQIRDWLFGAIISSETDTSLAIDRVRFDTWGFCGLFAEPLKQAIRQAFQHIEWPWPDAIPTPERAARMLEINAELDQLLAQKAELEEVLGDEPAGSGAVGDATAPAARDGSSD